MRQVDAGMRVFSADITEGIIGGLDPNLNYLFSISTSINIDGIIYEGQRNNPIPPVPYPNGNYVTTAVTSTVTSTVVSTVTTALLNNGEKIGLIVGVSVVYIPILILAISLLVIVLYMKKANNIRQRKSEDGIVMKCSPAYATTEFKTKSNVELVYDAPGSETPNLQALPPPTEYEVLTV
ncbi:PREDICTED: uncharacterized protein LOC109585828 [Amphimedon queenslandica]|nr:PREDICTED: uncharacterized protein LOC109585828 [Amphimedon queenslandica]|eukprot:XP_019857528.1 PREDICTED: uncharacterized protein LOC109585828 [Amphimedon queenslandica]